jgi:hypothetical protein
MEHPYLLLSFVFYIQFISQISPNILCISTHELRGFIGKFPDCCFVIASVKNNEEGGQSHTSGRLLQQSGM